MQGFKEGYDFFAKSTGAVFGADSGSGYVQNVNSAIDTLMNDLNQFDGYKTDSSKLQGDIAEFWHADTFNIDAAIKGSENRAYVDRSHEFASPDVSTNFGEKYGLKYYKDGVNSAKAQAKSVFERFKEYQAQGGRDPLEKFLEDRGYTEIDSVLNDPIYCGQKRLIPKDQLQDAIDWLEKKIAKESISRPEQVKRYRETLDLLSDRISDGEGTESIALSREDAQKLANLAKEGKIRAEDLGLTTEELITYEYILRQAFKSGLTSATVTLVLKTAPELINAINFLIKNGEIDAEHFKSIGFAAVSGAAEGFIRGTVSAGLTAVCKTGFLGEVAMNVNPSIIAMATVIVMDTMKNSFYVATGKMTKREMTDALIKETFVASMSFVVGTLCQTILTELPVLGFMIGSFVGSVVGNFAYTGSYKAILSFCVERGFTMFGLVSQDYTLPNEVLEEIGVSVFDYSKFEPTRFIPTQFAPTRIEPEKFKYTQFDTIFLRRGVIGIRAIGYV